MYGEHLNGGMMKIDSCNLDFLKDDFPISEIKKDLKLCKLRQDIQPSLGEGEDWPQAIEEWEAFYTKLEISFPRIAMQSVNFWISFTIFWLYMCRAAFIFSEFDSISLSLIIESLSADPKACFLGFGFFASLIWELKVFSKSRTY